MSERPKNATLVGLTGPRIIVVPRWSGTPRDDWYPWLREQLGTAVSTHVLALPDPGTPTVEAWTRGVVDALGDDPYSLARTLLVGHSVGCQAALRAVATLGSGRAVARLLCVAGWFTVDNPWDTILPWMHTPLDDAAVRDGAQKIHVLLSTNDPFTADHQANAGAWRDRLEAEVHVVPDAAHFNASPQPVVLEHVRALFAEL